MTKHITADNLTNCPNIKHGFFTRHDDQAAVQAAMGMPLLRCKQIHSSDVIIVEESWDAAECPEGDALVSDMPDAALAIITADCAPVLLADPVARVIGAAHAGWRGALDGVLENSVAAMEALGAERANIHAAIGPCIGHESYEVDAHFRHNVLSENDVNEAFFVAAVREGHFMFDLPAYAAHKLKEMGVTSVEALPVDTCKDEERFYSYRRAQDKGRQFSAVGLAGV